eukprot:10024731-Karenia_brevis.AAC.1
MEVSSSHERSVLIGILDPESRKHTAMHQGQNTSLEQFKKVVMEFANAVSGADPMQIGRVEEGQPGADGDEGAQCWTCEGQEGWYIGAMKGGPST